MYEYIIGKVVDVYEDYLVVENNGIGYKIYSTKNLLSNLARDCDVKIYTYMDVKEDAILLFGFSSKEEKKMFELLLLVSKVGPKTAVGVLSTLSSKDIKLAILSSNVEVLCKAPGIGKKTANRIILELKDRIDDTINSDSEFDFIDDSCMEEAIGALMVLGYTKKEIDRVILKMDMDNLDTEEIIKIALQKLSK